MNKGTKIRTAARVIVSLNTAVYAVSASVNGLGFGKLAILWAILTIASDFAVAFITTYYNNDYTIEGVVGTIQTRELKEQRDEPMQNFEEPEDAEIIEDYPEEDFDDGVGDDDEE